MEEITKEDNCRRLLELLNEKLLEYESRVSDIYFKSDMKFLKQRLNAILNKKSWTINDAVQYHKNGYVVGIDTVDYVKGIYIVNIYDPSYVCLADGTWALNPKERVTSFEIPEDLSCIKVFIGDVSYTYSLSKTLKVE